MNWKKKLKIGKPALIVIMYMRCKAIEKNSFK